MFNLALDCEMGEHYSLLKTGTLKLSIQFSEPLAKTTKFLVFGEFQNIIEVDQNRSVVSDQVEQF